MKKSARILSQIWTGLRVKYSLFLPNLMKIEFSKQFSKNPQIWSFTKIRAVGAELLHVVGGTDMKTPGYAKSLFENIWKVPKNDEKRNRHFIAYTKWRRVINLKLVGKIFYTLPCNNFADFGRNTDSRNFYFESYTTHTL